MDDLISRKDLIDKINELMKSPWFLDGYVGLKDMAESKLNEFQIIDRLKWDERKNAVVIVRDFCVRGTPAIPAVPLDKLCEWLSERYEPPYSLINVDKLKLPIDFRQQKEMWMIALTKWMEGLNDGSK
jgi:hypothetical protein